MLKYFELHKLRYFSVVNGSTEKKMKRKQLEKSVFEKWLLFGLHCLNFHYEWMSENIFCKIKCGIFSVTLHAFQDVSWC